MLFQTHMTFFCKTKKEKFKLSSCKKNTKDYKSS